MNSRPLKLIPSDKIRPKKYRSDLSGLSNADIANRILGGGCSFLAGVIFFR
jgi:hypothetical protein